MHCMKDVSSGVTILHRGKPRSRACLELRQGCPVSSWQRQSPDTPTPAQLLCPFGDRAAATSSHLAQRMAEAVRKGAPGVQIG